MTVSHGRFEGGGNTAADAMAKRLNEAAPMLAESVKKAMLATGIIAAVSSGGIDGKESTPSFLLAATGGFSFDFSNENGVAGRPGTMNKFSMLSCSFVSDILEKKSSDDLKVAGAIMEKDGVSEIRIVPFSVGMTPGAGFASDRKPSRMDIPAISAICRKMAATPGWLTAAINELDEPSNRQAP